MFEVTVSNKFGSATVLYDAAQDTFVATVTLPEDSTKRFSDVDLAVVYEQFKAHAGGVLTVIAFRKFNANIAQGTRALQLRRKNFWVKAGPDSKKLVEKIRAQRKASKKVPAKKAAIKKAVK